MTQRLFFGLPVAAPLAAALQQAIAPLRLPADWRWTPMANWHLTLLFLGATDEARLPALVELGEQCAAACAVAAGELTRLGGLPAPGGSGLSGRSRLLAALAEDAAPFLPLHTALRAGAQALGFPVETRPLLPHVTLARRGRTAAPWLIEPLPPLRAAVPIETLVLYRSEAGASGQRYVPLWRGPLRSR